MQNAILECNTHPSNLTAVPVGTGTVDTMDVTSGTNVGTDTVRGTRITTGQPHRAHIDRRTTKDGSFQSHSHAITP